MSESIFKMYLNQEIQKNLSGLKKALGVPSEMISGEIHEGDTVEASPVGAGVVTGFSERGYPQVNYVTVTWLRRTDGIQYDPHNRIGGLAGSLKDTP